MSRFFSEKYNSLVPYVPAEIEALTDALASN